MANSGADPDNLVNPFVELAYEESPGQSSFLARRVHFHRGIAANPQE